MSIEDDLFRGDSDEIKEDELFKKEHDLTDEQMDSLQDMSFQVQKELVTTPEFIGQDRSKVADKKQLLSQLRAREFNLLHSMEMWRKWMHWRREYDIDNIEVLSIESELKAGKAFWHKYDNQGNPCCVVRIKNHIAAETTHEKTIRFIIYLMEIGIKMAQKSGTGKMCVIWDREGFSSKNFDISFFSLLKRLSKMLQDNYAERLSHIYIIYPSFVMKQGFKLLRPFLATKVVQKFKIIEELDNLKLYFRNENLLKMHGGTSEFEYSYPNTILSDPLNAVLPFIESPKLQIEANFSFQNDQEVNEEMYQENIEQQSGYFSIDNDSTEFFNLSDHSSIENNEESDIFSKEIQQQSQQKRFQNRSRSPSPKSRNLYLLSENPSIEKSQTDLMNPKDPTRALISTKVPSEHQNVISSSGCCGYNKSITCTIF